jgi:hypothetical protein
MRSHHGKESQRRAEQTHHVERTRRPPTPHSDERELTNTSRRR